MGGVPWSHSTAGDLEWEGDLAHHGCRSWIGGWRETNGSDLPPPLAFARPVGEAAVRLAASGVGRVDLARLMWAAGRDGITAPDLEPGDTQHARAA